MEIRKFIDNLISLRIILRNIRNNKNERNNKKRLKELEKDELEELERSLNIAAIKNRF